MGRDALHDLRLLQALSTLALPGMGHTQLHMNFRELAAPEWVG